MDLSPQSSTEEIIAHLGTLGSEENRTGMARYGIRTERAFGISNAVLRPLARAIKRDHERALALWESGWREARVLASFTDDPAMVTREQALAWATDFDSWEIVDHAADLFAISPVADELIQRFATDEREFARRAAFAMMAWSAVHLKEAPDEKFLAWLYLIESHATDSRNFVKKAVNWALRQIGKRSLALHGPALECAERLAAASDRTARWIGKDALRELNSEKTLERMNAKAQRGLRRSSLTQ